VFGVTHKGEVLRSSNLTNTQVIDTLPPYEGTYGVNDSWYSHYTRRCTKSGWNGCRKREYTYYYHCKKYDVDYSFQRKVKSMMIRNGNIVYLDQLGAIWDNSNPFGPVAGAFETPNPLHVATNSSSQSNYQTLCQALGNENCGVELNN